MVDAIVSFAVQKLGDFLIERVELRLNVRDNIEWLRNELQFMQCFLDDADQKQTTNSLVQQWVREIRDLAHETVDILDEFISNGDDEAPRRGTIARVKRALKHPGPVKKIESLKQRVLDLSRKRDTYGITNISNGEEGTSSIGQINRSNLAKWRRTTSYLEEEHFVGFKDVSKTLLKELLKDEDSRNVISIHGMGGLGKTTLAKKLYKSVDVQNRFASCAWVCVSQEYNIKDLLQTIVKSFKKCSKEELEKLELMNEEDLERYLRQFLNKQRYLIVVDDVWRKEDWESLKRAFPDDHNGSRVIMTTRIKEVAERVGERSFIHHLRFLKREESWDLFIKEISRNGHLHGLSPAMQQMGEEMVQKCSGLPLAIIVLGGLLSHKKGIEQWRKVKDQLWQHMKNESIDISHMLSLSYKDLSGALKLCFLYIGIFPEDHLIYVEKLMHLWMAEGFISQGDIADDYLHELINRNLLQVVNRYVGKIRFCKIHDLLRDLAIEKAREVNLFHIYNPRVQDSAHSFRRLTVHTQFETFFSGGISSDKLRSLLFFNSGDFFNPQYSDTHNPKITYQKLKFLCVLDLDDVSLVNSSGGSPLPNAIGALVSLKFLSLRFTSGTFTQLPSTIGNLKRLQTLEVLSTSKYRLPEEICQLINMRYLNVYKSKGQLNINTLRNLRTLRGVQYDQWMKIDSANLVHLLELSMGVTPITGKVYSLNSLSNLKNLTTLELFAPMNSQSYLPPLEPLLSCPCLLRLRLKGRIEKLPSINEFPQSLTDLYLGRSRLSEDPMPTLEKLLNLRTLELSVDAYDGKIITCTNNGFLHLEHLELYSLQKLEKWILAETSMPVIRSLRIRECPTLEIPERLMSIRGE